MPVLATDRPIITTPSPGDAPRQHDDIAASQSDKAAAASPWWSAPSGRPVAIPAFGRTLIEILAALLFPGPRLQPVRVKARRRR